MNYLDVEKIIQAVMCVITVMIGIGFAFLIIIYEEKHRMALAPNVSGEVGYVFPLETRFNISG
jgi:hypothetical protein